MICVLDRPLVAGHISGPHRPAQQRLLSAPHCRHPGPSLEGTPMALIDLANPTRFLSATARALPWLGLATALAFALGLYLVWFVAPDDYQQGATVKIMFIH